MRRKVLIGQVESGHCTRLCSGRDLNPQAFSAYAPQTYVSASSTTRASRGSKLSADGNGWQVSSVVFLLMLLLMLDRGLETNRILCRMKYQRFAIKLRAGA